jgi:hypothetical protein
VLQPWMDHGWAPTMKVDHPLTFWLAEMIRVGHWNLPTLNGCLGHIQGIQTALTLHAWCPSNGPKNARWSDTGLREAQFSVIIHTSW